MKKKPTPGREGHPGLLILSCLLFATTPASHAGPITFNTALPISQGEFVLRGQAKWIRSSDDPGPMDRDLTVWVLPTVLAYGFNAKLTLFGVVPYLDKRLEVNTPLGWLSRGDSGLGDATFLARYTLWQRNQPGSTMRLAPFVGLKIPTGTDDKQDSLGTLPRPLQLGSGSWDPLLGMAFTWQTFDWEFDSAVSYKIRTTADGYRFGDQAEWDLSYQRRVWPREIGGGVPGFLYLVIESNVLWAQPDRTADQHVSDSGGTTWFLAPGIQYVTKRYVVETAVQIPIVQNLNGLSLKNDFILTAGFRINF